MKAQGAEKRGFGFPNGMRFREQIGGSFSEGMYAWRPLGSCIGVSMPYQIYQKTNGCRMPNASLQLLPKAGAKRTLEAVSCKALFGGLRVALPL